jgi:ribonuclease P/MRP protein subunit POP5
LLKRVKRRYLAIEIDSAEAFDSRELMEALWKAIEKLYGEYGASKTGLNLIAYDPDKKRLIIRVMCSALDMVRAAVASITKINDKPVALHVLTVSGTLKALHTKTKKQHTQHQNTPTMY